MAVPSDNEDDLVREFFSAVRSGKCSTVISLIETNPGLIGSVEDADAGNTALHIAVKACRSDLVATLLNYCKRKRDCTLRDGFLHAKNTLGETAYDLSLKSNGAKLKGIAWSLIQCGAAKESKKSGNEMLDAWPDPRTGENCFHVFARNNYAREIKRYSDDDGHSASFTRLCLEANNQGNTPAMEAAMRCNREALLALMQPFLVLPNGDELDRLLHHRNKEGENLLAYVSHHNKVLSVEHGILIELEAIAHNHDSFAVKECLRTSLGSTVSAEFSRNLFKNIRHKPRDHVNWFTTFLRVLLMTFAIRTFAYGLDMFTDLILLFDYYRVVQTHKIYFPGASIESTTPFYDGEKCLFDNMEATPRSLFDGEWPTYNVTLGCYPGAIKGNERFLVTLAFMLLPFPLYFFEMVRFRVFSAYIEKMAETHPYPQLILALKPVGNLFLWIFWPLVSFFRHFVNTFRYETTRNEDRAGDYQRKARKTAVIREL